MVQLNDYVESTHPEFAAEEVKKMKSELSLAITHLEKAFQAAGSVAQLNPFEERARILRDLASSLRRDLDHVI